MVKRSEDLLRAKEHARRQPTFDGQIKWRKGGNTIQWSERTVDARRGLVIESIEKAVFGSGNQGTNGQCQFRMISLATKGQRAVQFEMIRDIIEALWEGLIAVFSYPTFEKEEFVP